ncbi:MAG: hypothetical protein QOE57_2166 [Acidimicrobiaceae bacterium]|nr:hypothetical protein [Acidimicrobiaceae bacterium]
MIEEECVHGLDPAWCTFCRKRAAGELPGGVRRARATPPAKNRVAASRPAVATKRVPARAAERAPRGPGETLAKTRKVVFHAAPYGAWPSIAELGLLTAKELLGDDARLRAIRSDRIDLELEPGRPISIRDQRHMARANIEAHLDGIDLAGWLDILNERLFLFARQKELTAFLGRYQATEGLDVVVFDTARLLAATAGRIEVATVPSTAPVPWDRCPCRSRATFESLADFGGDVGDIEEITVVGGLPDVVPLVGRVIRYHPDRTTEVLVA